MNRLFWLGLLFSLARQLRSNEGSDEDSRLLDDETTPSTTTDEPYEEGRCNPPCISRPPTPPDTTLAPWAPTEDISTTITTEESYPPAGCIPFCITPTGIWRTTQSTDPASEETDFTESTKSISTATTSRYIDPASAKTREFLQRLLDLDLRRIARRAGDAFPVRLSVVKHHKELKNLECRSCTRFVE